MQGRIKHSFIELQTQDISLDNEAEIRKSVNGVTSKALRSEDSDALPLLSTEKSGIAEVASGSGIPSAVFNLATTVIGAGIMALPATMKVLGLPLCFTVIILMGILSEISIELLVEFSVRLKASNYGETVEFVCGHSARVLSEICIIVNNAGIMIVYLIIMGDVMSGSSHHQGLFDQWTGKEGWWSDRRLIVFITMVFVLAPLCALKKIDSLKFTYAASVALAVVFVVLSSIIAFVKLIEGKIERPRLLPDVGSKRDILDLLVVITIMTNAYICHFNVQPIYNGMQDRTPAKMNTVGRITTVLCVLVYESTAISGYLLFGQYTDSEILTKTLKFLSVPFLITLLGLDMCSIVPLRARCLCREGIFYFHLGTNIVKRVNKYLMSLITIPNDASNTNPSTKKRRETMVECCICGDVGFAEHLFQCGKCRFRFQHKYCSRRYFYEDHIEFCYWCFVESDKTSGFTANLHSHTKSKPRIIKKVDGKRSNGSNSIRSRSANGSTVKANGNEELALESFRRTKRNNESVMG